MPSRHALSAMLGVGLALSLAACGSSNKLAGGTSSSNTPSASDSSTASSSPSVSSSSSASSGGKVIIGSASFTEIRLMAEMYALLLQKGGYQTQIQVVQNKEIYEPALEKGKIDVVPDYAATMAEFLNTKKNGASAAPVATTDKVTTVAALNAIGQPLGLKALTAADAIDSNAFAVSKDFASKHNLKTLSDLGKSGIAVSLAATEECPTRKFCQGVLTGTYKIKIKKLDPLGFDTVQVKQALKTGKDDLGLVGTTDATLADFNLVILEDDKKTQLADNLVPVVGKKYAADAKFAAILNGLAPILTTADLATMNKQVDQERQKASDVAKKYLTDKGLL